MVDRIVEKIRAHLTQPVTVNHVALPFGMTGGVAIFPRDGDNVVSLMQHADAALHLAKATGTNHAVMYSAELHRSISERQRLEDALGQALAADQFELFFQPKVHALSHECVGFEALLRWQHPRLGQIPPDVFIPMSERTDLINSIGFWVLESACRQMACWRDQGLGNWPVAVNISVHQLQDMQLIGHICRLLDQYCLPAELLELEITESAAMASPENVILLLQGLRDLGVRIAMDDFGTGYSSLSYLRRLPVHTLKIDRSFIRDLGMDVGSEAIVSSTLDLAHQLGLLVVAEGVETQIQRDFLVAHQCDQLQGYLFGHPLPAEKLQFDGLATHHQQESQRACLDEKSTSRPNLVREILSHAPGISRNALLAR